MMRRCHDEKYSSYPNYGGRGIIVVPRWHTFDNFIADMGLRPKDHIIGRKDHDQDYSKENCVWEHRSLNGKHRRGEVLLTIDGQTRSVTEWARVSGVKRETIRHRIKSGWPNEKLLKPGKYALIREDAADLLAVVFKGVDFDGPTPVITIDDATWFRVKRFMSVSKHLLV